ncbi:TonB-dependent receptor [Acidisphaera sp. S103]|uniref:TonB-dependent receptor n=1 Tax=Acidisphaera sp. S103 TaxID=1747223 RepID=UPI00131DACC7|nr:TonB-dependent receptor [Acidisphaera sp. S103]
MAKRMQRIVGQAMRGLVGTAAFLALTGLAVRAQQAPSNTPPTPSATSPAPVVTVPTINIVGASPLLGSGVDRDTVPAETNVLRGGDLTRGGTTTPDATRSLNEEVGGVNLDSASGNPYQPTLLYHGFAASGLQGTPQGLAVYVNGVRFNQAFGDTVNFDLLPNLAIDQMNLEGANPVFGLNALGGALNIQLKNGFTYQGAELSIHGGSFNTIGGDFQFGKQSGNTSVYVAASGIRQDGWRDLQSSDLENFYGDIGWRGNAGELHFNALVANSTLNGPGTSPVELLAADPKAQFTGPNQIANRFMQVGLSGTMILSDTVSIQANTYYNNFLQRVTNGNAANDTPCNDGSGLLCSDSGYSTTTGGATIPAFLGANPFSYSELDNQTTNTNGYGASAQVTDTQTVFGFNNHLVAGVSFDGSQTQFTGVSYIGGITADSRVFVGPGVVIDEPGNNQPVRVGISDAYYGAFIADTFNLTDRLALTASGRFNSAQIDLSDQNGGDLTGNHAYQRFNPSAGVTYKVMPWLTAYAGYAEANRAPTPAELSCAGPNDSCSLANFFVGDPNLKQVIAHTVEVGVRGTVPTNQTDRLTYNLGFYRSSLDDDIAFVNSVTLNRAFFTNIGQTRRQGIDASLQYKAPRWSAYIAYTYTDATFQTGFVEAAGSNPAADANGNITINPGARMPGVPAHQGKVGLTFRITDQWTVGAVLLAQSGQYLFGDEANLTPQLPGFVTLNLSSSYQVTPHIQLFGSIENVTDAKYYTYGTFSPTTAVFLSQAPNATNPRAYSPAAPIGAFGGVRITF